MKEFILHTKKLTFYFRGRIVLYDRKYQIVCISYGGGPRYADEIFDWKTKTKKEMLQKIKRFKLRHNLLSTK